MPVNNVDISKVVHHKALIAVNNVDISKVVHRKALSAVNNLFILLVVHRKTLDAGEQCQYFQGCSPKIHGTGEQILIMLF